MGHLESFVFSQSFLSDQPGEEGAVDATRQIVTSRNGKECPRIVIEADGVVETGCLSRELAETHHAFRAIEEPPWRAQPQAWIVPGERRELTAEGRFV